MRISTYSELEKIMLTGVNLTGTWPSNSVEWFGLPSGEILVVRHHSGTPIGKMQHRVSWSYKLLPAHAYEQHAHMENHAGPHNSDFPGKLYLKPIYEFRDGKWNFDVESWESCGIAGWRYKGGQYVNPEYRWTKDYTKEWSKVD